MYSLFTVGWNILMCRMDSNEPILSLFFFFTFLTLININNTCTRLSADFQTAQHARTCFSLCKKLKPSLTAASNANEHLNISNRSLPPPFPGNKVLNMKHYNRSGRWTKCDSVWVFKYWSSRWFYFWPQHSQQTNLPYWLWHTVRRNSGLIWGKLQQFYDLSPSSDFFLCILIWCYGWMVYFICT